MSTSRTTALAALAALAMLIGEARAKAPTHLHQLTVTTIDGKKKKLSDYKGKALLVVNTASRCGFTPQLAGLQKLYERYRKRGFEVLAFPSNDFGGQEPGTSDQIRRFCEERYKTTFPLFAKVHAKGPAKAPVYEVLTRHAPKPMRGEIRWNFTKFVVAPDGRIAARFEPPVKPMSKQLTAAVEAVLPKK